MNTNKYTGLNDKEVVESRKKYGSNMLVSRKKNSFLGLVIESLSDPIIKILLIALCVKIIFSFQNSNVYETLGIAIAVFLASFISAISEYGSEKAFERLSKENSLIKVKVIRNSKKQVISIDEIVVGDIILLESGDKVPGDGKMLEGTIFVDDSSLTGETIEKQKSVGDKIYSGSIVNDGNATMIISGVGEDTFYGRVASLIQEKSDISPLKVKLNDFAKIISKIGYIGAILVFISYMFNSLFLPNHFNLEIIFRMNNLIPHLIYGITLSVAVVVMAVPEGLPMMITLVLSSNMKKLLKKNVLVRKLVGIETAGSLNILFTDKTGTLTEGNLKVQRFVTPDLFEYDSINKIEKSNNYEIIYQSLVYNNDSFFTNGSVEGGNITDKAILKFVNSNDKSKYKIININKFNSKLKYSSIITNYNNKTSFYKGAYEIILDKCTRYLDYLGEEHILNNKNMIKNYIDEKTNHGERVLALAYNHSNELDNLTLIGLIFLKDNIRKEALSGINLIKSAGIQVVMVTGDAKNTALSVAKELKIVENDNDLILTSEELSKMSDEEVINNLSKLRVLSRSLPEDKNRLVKLAESMNLVVGMTGDGVNDAPALKKSSVGFSMGSGTEIAKETSDIVIIDNNINSIATSILYGRTIFKSIRKFIIFQLSVNCCTVLLSIIGPFVGILSPITVIQVLWVNMVMDTFAGLAFSFEPALIEYMSELPKKKNEKIINSYMKNQIFFDGIYSMLICIWFLKSKFINSFYRITNDNRYLMTAFFGLFIFIDIFNAFNARTNRINTFANLRKNKVFLIVFMFITIIQILLIYYGGEIFRTTGLNILEFDVMLLIAFSVIPFDIIRKIILKKKGLNSGV